MPTEANEEIDNLKEARKFAWNHFDLHAKQRMEMFRSYVTFIALIYAGFGASLQAKVYFIGASLSIFSILISIAFFLFDLRIRQLLKISERYLLNDEKRLGLLLSNSNIRLFHKSDLIIRMDIRYFKLTYSNLFRLVYFANVIVSIIFLLILIAVASS